MELNEKVYYTKLLDMYGCLLTNKQQSIMSGFYLYDLSYSELAEQNNTTRQAIFDSIQKSNKLLLEYENKLKFNFKKEEILKLLQNNKLNKEMEIIKEKILNL